MAIDRRWHKKQIEEYTKEYLHYEKFAQELRQVFTEACKQLAPMSIVQVRPKSVSSFAEKAIRKAGKYPNPAYQLTDLCGARIITETMAETYKICEFIKENFKVDEANSEDTRSRLASSEFGYLSVHFIISLPDWEAMKIPVSPEGAAIIGQRKAEIQVRTILQHTWADVVHDRVYKSSFEVPAELFRVSANLAALLENADKLVSEFTSGVDSFKQNYNAYMTPEKMAEEIGILEVILENEPVEENKPAIALKIAQIARAAGDWDRVIAVLEAYESYRGRLKDEMQIELGYARCSSNREQKRSKEYLAGQKNLEAAAKPDVKASKANTESDREKNLLRAKALSLLAWSYRDVRGKEKYTRDLYQKAYECDMKNPYIMASYLEYELFCMRGTEFLHIMKKTLYDMVETCRAHAKAGIELPTAYFVMGRFYLLLGQAFKSLSSYAKGIQLCVQSRTGSAADGIESELEFIKRINYLESMPEEHKWAYMLLLAGKCAASSEIVADEFRETGIYKIEFSEPILLMPGGTSKGAEPVIGEYREYLEEALKGFSGTIISGGTNAGISGLLAEVAGNCNRAANREIRLAGYLPGSIPHFVQEDERYDELFHTSGSDFSPLEPLQAWLDILSNGIKPENVTLIGINGGNIAAFEYRLALALGANVGLVQSSGREVFELLNDSDWSGSGNLYCLPADKMTIKAFLTRIESSLEPEQLEEAGRVVHENYLRNTNTANNEPSMKPWDELTDDFRTANMMQVVRMEEILGMAGYGIRPAAGKISYPEFTDDEIEKMSELEHGHWNVQRMKAGWRYGPKKDFDKKLTPYIVAWDMLSDNIKELDRNAVRNYPATVAMAGMEVYKR